MIKIRMGNIFSKVEMADSRKEENALRKELTFPVPNFWFMPSYRKRIWNGMYSFYNDYAKTFPTGLLTLIKDKFEIVLIDNRKKPEVEVVEPALHGIELRDYQMEAINQALELERCIIQAPTNGGKTECAAGVISALQGARTLWITHRGNLLYQTRDRLVKRLGVEVGVVHRDTLDIKDVTVGMVNTLYNRLYSKNKETKSFFRNWLKNSVDVLIIDEAHHTSATTWFSVTKLCDAYFRIGLSATPLMRHEIQNLRLIAMTGNVIETVTNKELIRRGVSARPKIMIVKNRIHTSFTPRNWGSSYRVGIERNRARNSLIEKIVRFHSRKKEPILILVNTLMHAHNLKRSLQQIRCVLVSGSTPPEERNVWLKKLEEGEISAIIATPLFDEGADVPNIRVLILASGGKSHLRLLQRIGRGLRRKPSGLNEIKIYDFADKGDKYLEAHSHHRFELYKKEGFDVIPLEISR